MSTANNTTPENLSELFASSEVGSPRPSCRPVMDAKQGRPDGQFGTVLVFVS